MTQNELDELVEKYNYLSQSAEYAADDEGIAYDRFAYFLKNYPKHPGLSDSDDEESLWEQFKEVEDDYGNDWSHVDLPE
ncbi:MAG: hypothetical protein WCJ95_16740 [Mariniphaga sp.]